MIFSKNSIGPLLLNLKSLFPIHRIIGNHKHLPFLPFYHAIGEIEVLPHIRHLYTPKSEKEFIADLDYILKYFKPISLEEMIAFSHQELSINQPFFHLTFDDGLRQVYETVLPILERKGIPATIFLNSDFIDNKALFFRYKVSLLIHQLKSKASYKLLNINTLEDINEINSLAHQEGISFSDFLSEYQPYMTSSQIKDAIKRGFTFGGHSMNHPYYDRISLDEQKKQTVESIEFIKRNFQVPYSAFAFPFSDLGVSNQFFDNINSIDISFGTSGVKEDAVKNHFQRTGMEQGSLSTEDILYQEYSYYALLKLIGKHVRKR